MPGIILPSDPRYKAIQPGKPGFLDRLGADFKGIVDPRNYVAAGKQLVTHPVGFAETLGKSYANIAEHPLRNLSQNPLSTLLAVAPVAGGVGALAKAGRVGEVGRLAALRSALVEDTAGAKGLSFNHIKPEVNPSLRHVTAQRGGVDVGHISYHQLPDGGWMVQQIRVPEQFRRQGIGTRLFHQASQDVGGKLQHQNDPALLSPEGAAFRASFESPAPSAAAVRAQLRQPLQGSGPGKAYGSALRRPTQTPEEILRQMMEDHRH